MPNVHKQPDLRPINSESRPSGRKIASLSSGRSSSSGKISVKPKKISIASYASGYQKAFEEQRNEQWK